LRTLFGIEISAAVQYVVAFGVIFVLLALFALVLRRVSGNKITLQGQDRTRARQPRLGVVDIYDLDRQRQLVLVRRDNIEHLVMIGGPNDVVVEMNIIKAQVRNGGLSLADAERNLSIYGVSTGDAEVSSTHTQTSPNGAAMGVAPVMPVQVAAQAAAVAIPAALLADATRAGDMRSPPSVSASSPSVSSPLENQKRETPADMVVRAPSQSRVDPSQTSGAIHSPPTRRIPVLPAAQVLLQADLASANPQASSSAPSVSVQRHNSPQKIVDSAAQQTAAPNPIATPPQGAIIGDVPPFLMREQTQSQPQVKTSAVVATASVIAPAVIASAVTHTQSEAKHGIQQSAEAHKDIATDVSSAAAPQPTSLVTTRHEPMLEDVARELEDILKTPLASPPKQATKQNDRNDEFSIENTLAAPQIPPAVKTKNENSSSTTPPVVPLAPFVPQETARETARETSRETANSTHNAKRDFQNKDKNVADVDGENEGDPFTIEAIEAEFARLLGRSPS
jgi:flagellar protein FliO/FliZ